MEVDDVRQIPYDRGDGAEGLSFEVSFSTSTEAHSFGQEMFPLVVKDWTDRVWSIRVKRKKTPEESAAADEDAAAEMKLRLGDDRDLGRRRIEITKGRGLNMLD